MNKEQHLGRNLLILVTAIPIFVSLVLAIGALIAGAIVPIVRLFLTIGLFYVLWIGIPWARWLLATFYILGGIAGLLAFVSHQIVWLLIVNFLYICLGVLLAFSPQISSFLQYQAGKRSSKA